MGVGTGQLRGESDANIDAGLEPAWACERILAATACGLDEVCVCAPHGCARSVCSTPRLCSLRAPSAVHTCPYRLLCTRCPYRTCHHTAYVPHCRLPPRRTYTLLTDGGGWPTVLPALQVWIARPKELVLAYLNQYLPTRAKRQLEKMAKGMMQATLATTVGKDQKVA